MTDGETVTLRSKDNVEYTLLLEAAKLCKLVQDATEDQDEDDDDHDVIDVPRVSSDTLKLVVAFLVQHRKDPMHEIPTPLNGTSFAEIVSQEWYREFLAHKERDQVFDLLTAANFMGIKPLLDLTCLKVTFELTGKSAEEIRVILNLPELSPEEEATARQEHRWIFEDS